MPDTDLAPAQKATLSLLVVDDDQDIRDLMADYLRQHGFQVRSADGGDAMFACIEEERPDLIVLDIMMPEMDGISAMVAIREFSNVPVILLTAKSEDTDKVLGLNLGADDYVTKPFSPGVLVKRVEAILKRSTHSAVGTDDIISINGLVIDIPAHTVTNNSKNVDLTIKEHNILVKLAKNHGRIFSREQLLDSIWGIDFIGDPRTVDSHVARLRTKLGEWGEAHLKTVYGVGYKIEVDKS